MSRVLNPRQKCLFSLITLGALLCSTPTWAAGKKKPSAPPAGGGCSTDPSQYTTPNPVRKVLLKPVGTKAFNMPNGSRVDLTADLDAIFITAVANSTGFSPTDASGDPNGGNDPCGTHLEVRGAITTLELNAFEAGINFGYTPSGETATSDSLKVKSNVRVGTIAMDFSVWQCTAGVCSAVGAATSSALTAGVSLSLQIDFGSVNTSPDLVYNTPLGGILRGIMNDGLKSLSNVPRLSELTWTARVRESIPETGILIFDAGAQSRIGTNQAFTVYAPTASSGICGVFKEMARVHTTQVGTVSSTAIIDEALDNRGVQEGDVVMVRATGKR